MRSTVTLFVLAFVLLGLLLVFAASYDAPKAKLPENIEERDPKLQQKLFEECIQDAKKDGRLTDDEYNECAYSIYG